MTKTPRPKILESTTTSIPTGYGKLYLTITEYEDKSRPFEIFCTVGKAGSSTQAKAEAVGRLVSLALRHDIPLADIVEQLIDIDGGNQIAWKDTVVKSIPDAVGKVLKWKYLE